MITSILFDMDGVLIDSQPMHYEADISTLSHFGVSMSAAGLEKYAGTTNVDRYTRFKNTFHMESTVEEMVAFREACIMNLIQTTDVSPMNGIPKLLKSIRDCGLKAAVASSSSYDLIYAVLNKFGLREYFDQVVSGEDMEKGKPAPDIFLEAAKRLDSLPEQCVVIEDSCNGVLAACRAHMKVIGYINPNSGLQDLSSATEVIDDFSEIDGMHLKRM